MNNTSVRGNHRHEVDVGLGQPLGHAWARLADHGMKCLRQLLARQKLEAFGPPGLPRRASPGLYGRDLRWPHMSGPISQSFLRPGAQRSQRHEGLRSRP